MKRGGEVDYGQRKNLLNFGAGWITSFKTVKQAAGLSGG